MKTKLVAVIALIFCAFMAEASKVEGNGNRFSSIVIFKEALRPCVYLNTGNFLLLLFPQKLLPEYSIFPPSSISL